LPGVDDWEGVKARNTNFETRNKYKEQMPKSKARPPIRFGRFCAFEFIFFISLEFGNLNF